MKRVLLVMVIVCLLLSVSFVSAGSPTQQYSKIYIDPYYRESMTEDTWYDYQVTVDPPDGISGVINAIIGFSIFLTPTVEFTLKVNNQSCNNPSYLVHTTYASTEYAGFSFDCSNIIIGPGTYDVSLMSSKNTGASNGWLDLTYMNNPPGTMEVSGTEYEVGDRSTAFLQLADDSGLPVNNAACYLDIYYPELINASHPTYVENAPMVYKDDSDGVYFYDMVVPNVTGVWMLSATCSYAYGAAYAYYLREDVESPERNVLVGEYTGSTLFLNDFGEFTYTSCQSGGTAPKVCDAYYDYNLSIHFSDEDLENVTSLELFYMGEATYAADLEFYWWNWSSSSWVILPNTLIFSGKSSTAGPTGLNDFQSNVVPIEAINNVTNVVRIRTYSYNTINFYQYTNWLNIRVLTVYGTVHELKGSSEMHVTSHLTWIQSVLSNIWTWLTETLWPKILSMEQTLNVTFNNTETIIETTDLIKNDTETIIELVNESVYVASVQGTDYSPGDNGRVFLKLIKDDLPINDEVCLITIHDPASIKGSTSYLIYDGLMNSIGEDGLYYYDFTVPDEEGVYMVSAKCFVGENTTVFNPISDNLIEGIYQSGSVNDISVTDGVYYVISEQNNGLSNRSYVHDFYFNFSSLNESLVTFAAAQFVGRVTPDTVETIKMQIYNYTSASFIDFPNVIPSQDGSNNIMVSTTGDGAGLPHFKNASGIIRIRLKDTQRTSDITSNVIRIDSLNAASTVIVSTPIKEVAGGGELNIRVDPSRLDQMWVIS